MNFWTALTVALNTLLVFYYLPTGAVVTGVLNLHKAFPKRYSFIKSQETKAALSNISASLSLHVTSFVGKLVSYALCMNVSIKCFEEHINVQML